MWWRKCNCSSLLIYRPREDERLSWAGRLTYSGRHTHISGHPLATGRAHNGERTLARNWRSTAEPSDEGRAGKFIDQDRRSCHCATLPPEHVRETGAAEFPHATQFYLLLWIPRPFGLAPANCLHPLTAPLSFTRFSPPPIPLQAANWKINFSFNVYRPICVY